MSLNVGRWPFEFDERLQRGCSVYELSDLRGTRSAAAGGAPAFAFDQMTAHLRLGTDGRAGVDATNVALGERETSDGG